MNRALLLALVVFMIFSAAFCAPREGTRIRNIPSKEVLIVVNGEDVRRTISRQILGQAVFASWQAYAWDEKLERSIPGALRLFKDLGMGIVGHYPGVGVVTHDFHWKNLIGPVERRKDPTPPRSLLRYVPSDPLWSG